MAQASEPKISRDLTERPHENNQHCRREAWATTSGLLMRGYFFWPLRRDTAVRSHENRISDAT